MNRNLPAVATRTDAFVAGLPATGPHDRLAWKGGGLYDAEGWPDPLALAMMGDGPRLSEARREAAAQVDEALFCGRYRPHFGHLLAEGVGRLWAVDRLPAEVPLVWFAHPRAAAGKGLLLAGLLRLLRVVNPVRIVTDVAQAGRLHVPPSLNDPLFGQPAQPALHDWIAARIPPAPPAAPAERIYLSRNRLGDGAGRYLGEAALEAALTREGYRILHPQDLPLDEQVASYRAARKVILAEGSALHLLALLDIPGQEIALVMRRPRPVGGIPRTLLGFRRARIVAVDRIMACWNVSAETRALFRAVAEIDHRAAWTDLAREGFVAAGDPPPFPDAAGIAAERRARAADRPVCLPRAGRA